MHTRPASRCGWRPNAVATPEPLHGILTRQWLETRAARFVASEGVLAALDGGDGASSVIVHRDPCDTTVVLAEVPVSDRHAVHETAVAAHHAQQAWALRTVSERAARLDAWAEVLEASGRRAHGGHRP